MRLLLSAFAISPNRGSEPGLGWQFASRLAQMHDVTVLYGNLNGRGTSQTELEEWLRDHPDAPRITLAFVAPSRLAILCERLHAVPGLRPFYYWGYELWQKRALACARDLHRVEPFDAVHQLTYAAYWEPGYLWKLGIPFFWGPISGGNVIPLRYIPILGVQGAAEAVARFVMNSLRLLTRPRIGLAAQRAQRIWCVTGKEQQLLSRFCRKISIMLEAGTGAGDTRTRSLVPGNPLQVIWSGLHISRKALPILVEAVAQLKPGSDVVIHVIGAGRGSNKETEKAKSRAEYLGVSSKIIWHGMLPHDRALQIMHDGHVLVHTSLLEATSTVVMEALSSGMPVICHDAYGMAAAITTDCGIKVPMTGVRDSIRGFRDAIQSLVDNPSRVKQLSEGAALRAQAFTWEKKIAEFNRAYECRL